MKFTRRDKSQDMILAQNRYHRRIKHSPLNNNVCLVGASGRGKTRNFIKPNIMQMNGNYVISDPKGVLVQELGTMLENNGYIVKVLNLVDLELSDSYNPFDYLKNESDVYTLIDYLMENFTARYTRWHEDPFWDNAAKALLSAICFYIMEDCPESDRNFRTVLKIICSHEASSEWNRDIDSVLDVLMKELEERNPTSTAVAQYKLFKNIKGAERAEASIMMSAAVYLQHFNLPEYDRLTNRDSIHMDRLSYSRMAVFVITSDTDPSKNWLAGLFYSQLIDILSKTPNNRHIHFFMDDFVCCGKIPEFDYKLAMFRSRNISCTITLQDEAQLEKEYGNAAQSIISNCAHYVFMGSYNIDACDAVAKRMAKRNITGRKIRKMSLQKCVVITGRKSGIYRKYDLKKHPRYKEIVDDFRFDCSPPSKSPLLYDLRSKTSLCNPPPVRQRKIHVRPNLHAFTTTEKLEPQPLIEIPDFEAFEGETE